MYTTPMRWVLPPLALVAPILFAAATGQAQQAWVRAERSAADAAYPPAKTQPASWSGQGASVPETGAYDRHIQDAVAAFNARHWSEARAAFQAAHTLAPSARTLRGLGLSAFYLNDWVEAATTMREALRSGRKPLTQPQREELAALLQRTYSHVGRLRVELVPAQARLSVDGQLAHSDDSRALLLTPGLHRLEASFEGYRNQARTLVIERGEQGTAVLVLEAIVESAAASSATHAPTAPDMPPEQPEPAGTAKSSRPRALGTARWVALGTGAALGVGASLIWREAQQRTRRLEAECGTEGCSEERRAERIEEEGLLKLPRWTNVALAGAGLSAVAACVLYFLELRLREKSLLRASVNGVSVSGRF